MDLAQLLMSYAEWIFFIAWGALLGAVSVITFGRDILPVARHAPVDHTSRERARVDRVIIDRVIIDRAIISKEQRWADGD